MEERKKIEGRKTNRMTTSAQRAAEKPESDVLISADSHVSEPEELWDRLPADLRRHRPQLETLAGGGERYTIEGSTISLPYQESLTEDDWACEYRRDPSGAGISGDVWPTWRARESTRR